MSDQNPTPASPTGTPIISPAVMRVVVAVYALLLAITGALVAVYGTDWKPGHAAMAVLGAVGTFLGIASPGLRMPTMKVLALLFLLQLPPGCATAKSDAEIVITALSDCARADVQGAVPQLEGVVAELLISASDGNWKPTLDALAALGVKNAQAVVTCTIAAVRDKLPAMAHLTADEKHRALVRASGWLTARGVK